jgi:hypothetical protein
MILSKFHSPCILTTNLLKIHVMFRNVFRSECVKCERNKNYETIILFNKITEGLFLIISYSHAAGQLLIAVLVSDVHFIFSGATVFCKKESSWIDANLMYKLCLTFTMIETM